MAYPAESDSETEGLRAYVAYTNADPRVVHHLRPLRDGLSICRRL